MIYATTCRGLHPDGPQSFIFTTIHSSIGSRRCSELLLFDFPLRRRVRFLQAQQFSSGQGETCQRAYLGERVQKLDLGREHVVDLIQAVTHGINSIPARERLSPLLTQPMPCQCSLLFEILGNDHYRKRVSAICRNIGDFLAREQDWRVLSGKTARVKGIPKRLTSSWTSSRVRRICSICWSMGRAETSAVCCDSAMDSVYRRSSGLRGTGLTEMRAVRSGGHGSRL